MNIKDYPKKLHTTSKDGLIQSISIKDKDINLSKLINTLNSILKIDDDIKLNDSLYVQSDKLSKYIITLDKTYLTDGEQNNITVYTSEGSKVLKITDKYLDHTHFTRSIGNVTNTINNKKLVTNTRVSMRIDPVRLKKTLYKFNNLYSNDPSLGTLDLETSKTKDISKVYAIGFYTRRYGVKTFYINPDTLDSNKLIIDCLDSMLVSKYTGYTLYTHNLGKLDITFILKTLVTLKRINSDYKLEFISRDDLILCLNVSKIVSTKTYTIKIVDSNNILKHSLSKLCVTYETEVTKDLFPSSFVTYKHYFITELNYP